LTRTFFTVKCYVYTTDQQKRIMVMNQKLSITKLAFIGIPTLLCTLFAYRIFLSDYFISTDPIENIELLAADHTQQLFDTGISLINEKKYDQALGYFTAILKQEPQLVPALHNTGMCLFNLGYFNQAEIAFANTLHHEPLHEQARIMLARLCTNKHTDTDYQQAIAHLQHNVQHGKTSLGTFLQIADTLLWMGAHERAHQLLKQLLVNNNRALVHTNIGHTYEQHNMFDQAIAHYQHAIELEPNDSINHIAYAGACLATGDYVQGYQEYEWRWHISNMKNLADKWTGQDIKGKKLLLMGENGLGDILQYLRFAQTMKDQGAYIIVQANPALTPLLKLCSYIDEVSPTTMPMPVYDYRTSLQSIPHYIGITRETVPNKPYIFADKSLITQWAEKVDKSNHKKIGICWRAGGDAHKLAHQKRSLNKEALEQLLSSISGDIYCLQKDITSEEKKLLTKYNVTIFSDLDTNNGAFMDTAALMKNLNLIISVDTSVAHVAGALGTTTITLLPYNADPRWMSNRVASPWYPTMQLVRQTKPGNWEPVITQALEFLQ